MAPRPLHRPLLDLRLRIGGIGPIGGDVRLAGMPLPNSDRALDILDTYVTAIREANVDPIADALVDDRGDADPTGLGARLQARRDVDAVAVKVVVFNDDIAKIDADSEHDGRLARVCLRQRGAGALQFTASTTLPNSTMVPSPISFTMRPLWAATAGSKMVSRCRFRAASVPASSAPIRRE